MSTVLCITGMHRSGTSLLASWLERCGLSIHDGRVLGPHTGNPKGHFEDMDFYLLQAAAITRLEPASISWKLFGVDPRFFDDDHLATARSLIDQRNAKFPLWGWKDPRSVVYLDQWKRLVPNLKVLLLWRPCAEVVTSLVNRSGKESYSDVHIELNDALRLWADYSARMCAYTAAHPADTILCNIHSIGHRDRDFLQLLNDRLGLSLQYVPLAELFDPSIFGRDPGAIAEAVSARDDVRLLNKALAERSSLEPGDASPDSDETLGGNTLHAVLTELSHVLGKRDTRMHSLAQQVRDLEATVNERGLQIEEEQRQVANMQAVTKPSERPDLERQLAAQLDVISELTTELERLRRHPLYRAYESAKRMVGGGGVGQ